MKSTRIHGIIYRDRDQAHYLSIGLDTSLQEARQRLQELAKSILTDLEEEVVAGKRRRFECSS